MALPTFEMGSYGLLLRTKSGLFEIVDACISAAASHWPEELQDHILRLLGVDPLKAAAGNGNGKIMAKIIVSNRKLRRPPMNSSAKEAVVAEANRKAPREFSVEEKRKIDGGRVPGFAGKEEERSRSPRKWETADHHQRRRRLEDDYYGGRKRNLVREDRYYGGRQRNFEEEYYSAKRRRIDDEASATTTARKRRVIQYSRRFLLSLRPM